MHRKAVIFLFGTLVGAGVLASTAFGQTYQGTWVMTSGTTKLTLMIGQGTGNQVSGTLSSSTGAVFHLNGRIEEGVVVGTCQGQAGSSHFEASLEGSLLILTLIEVGATGETTSRSLEFTRAAGGTSPSAALGLPPAQPGSATPKARAPSSLAPPHPAAPQPPRGAGSPVSAPEMGISFTAPAGWGSQKQGDAMFLTSTTHKGFILIQRHAYDSIERMANDARQGIVDEAAGIRLIPASQFQAFGRNGLAAEFSGMVQGRQARTYAVGLIAPGGGGVTIMAAVEAQSYTDAYSGFARSIAESLTFISAESSAGRQAGGPANTDLMGYFAGEWYSYTSGSTIYGSAGTERKMTLCPNGLYRDSSEFSASGGDWGGASEQARWGRWTIQGNSLQGVIMVRYPNGQSRRITYQKNSRGGKIFDFDGIMFVFAGEAACR